MNFDDLQQEQYMDNQQMFFEEAITSPSQSQISLDNSDTTSQLISPTTKDCSQPPQCTTPISLMYDFLAHHNLPCKYKPAFEHNAQVCLLSLGEGDHDVWSGNQGKPTSHTREQRRKKKQDKRMMIRDHVTGQASQKVNGDHVSGKEEIVTMMTSDDVFSRLFNLLSPKLISEGLGQWITCPYLHRLNNIPDVELYKSKSYQPRRFMGHHYHGDTSTHHRGRQANSASGRLGVKQTSSVVVHGVGSNKEAHGSRPTSSGVTEKDTWQDMELELQHIYSFKHYKHTQQYAEQYRDTYTYYHLREKSVHVLAAVKLQKTSIPRAGLVCYKSANRNTKGMTGSKISNNGRGQGSIVEPREESSIIKWQMSPRLKDSCDAQLSVNNPTPTELTTLGKMPVIHRSSPSIPSNTNGKYGTRGSSILYPFHLQISTDSRTVSSPYKRGIVPRSLLG